jgi:hypothetical protein
VSDAAICDDALPCFRAQWCEHPDVSSILEPQVFLRRNGYYSVAIAWYSTRAPIVRDGPIRLTESMARGYLRDELARLLRDDSAMTLEVNGESYGRNVDSAVDAIVVRSATAFAEAFRQRAVVRSSRLA